MHWRRRFRAKFGFVIEVPEPLYLGVLLLQSKYICKICDLCKIKHVLKFEHSKRLYTPQELNSI